MNENGARMKLKNTLEKQIEQMKRMQDIIKKLDSLPDDKKESAYVELDKIGEEMDKIEIEMDKIFEEIDADSDK
jgi:hypothetical protein